MKSPIRKWGLVASLLISSNVAIAAPSPKMTIKGVMLAALKSDQAVYQDFVSGEMAQKFKQGTRSDSPVQAKAVVLKRYEQKGCARLAVFVGQAEVRRIDGNTAPFETQFNINICSDGSPPAAAPDVVMPSK